jgi:hypothetical protein
MTTTAADRAARAKRARQQGNQRATPVKTPPPPVKPASPAIPAQRQAKAVQAKAATKQPSARSTRASEPTSRPVEGPAKLDLNQVVSNMDLSQVQCFDFGHSWRPYSARWLPSYNSYESQLQCMRCKTVRTRFLSRTGEQLNSNYDYAEGYLVKGMGRLTGHDRDVIRLASILAVISPDTAEE